VPHAGIVLTALLVESVVGYPGALHARIPHPVVWAGRLIAALERRWNQTTYSVRSRYLSGCLTTLCITGLAAALGYGVEALARAFTYGWIVVAIVGTVGLAQRSLYQHVRNVLDALKAEDVDTARQRVSYIVGRDTVSLDPPGIAAAALESLAESFNDGVLAPAFWFLVGGLPGLFAYKALNTADSMIGHKEERWRAFGWASARADDLANLAPARIAGALLAVAGGGGFATMLRDASKHASPNAGWPEAAMAGALRIRLGGAAMYDGVAHERPVFGNGRPASVDDLAAGLRLYIRACALMWLIVMIIGFA